MKNLFKLILFSVVLIAASDSQAQTIYNMTVVTATDTLSSAGTGSASIKLLLPAAMVTVQAEILKVSGAPAGTAVLQGRLIGVSAAWNTVPGASSFTITDVAAQYPLWVVTGCPFNEYRILYTNSAGGFSTLTNKLRVGKYAPAN